MGFSCEPKQKVAPPKSPDEPATSTESGAPTQKDEHYYGVYLNGIKVGWMRNTYDPGKMTSFATHLEARVAGMGSEQSIQMSEKRVYDTATGKLSQLEFSQKAATGEVSVNGEVVGESLKLTIGAGGAKSTKTFPVEETLEDALAQRRLAKKPQVGKTVTAKRFDPSIQKLVTLEHKVEAVEEKLFGGVKVKVVKIASHYQELQIDETTWLDSTGKIYESKVGGFFVARLEPAHVAKKLDYQQDILVSAVVRTPQPIEDAEELSTVTVEFSGFEGNMPPISPRQKVSKKGQYVQLELSRDPQPPKETLPTKASAHTEATPFIQSDAAEMRQKAKEVIGDAKDTFTAVSRLSAFVYEHVRDEYVPAYSNALEALKSGRGDCTEHSVLFVALARSLNIPARVAVGIAYWPPGNGFGWHAWAEVKIGNRWYAVDPTWNQPIADATHIKLAEGDPAAQARIVMLLGRLKVHGLKAS